MNSFLFIVFYSFLHHCQQPDGVQYRSRRSRLYHWKGERTLFRSAATRKKYSVGTIFSAISKHYDAVLGQRSWSACMFCVCEASVVRNSLQKSLPVFHLLYNVQCIYQLNKSRSSWKKIFLHVHFQRSFIRSRYHGNSTFGEIFLNDLKNIQGYMNCVNMSSLSTTRP